MPKINITVGDIKPLARLGTPAGAFPLSAKL